MGKVLCLQRWATWKLKNVIWITFGLFSLFLTEKMFEELSKIALFAGVERRNLQTAFAQIRYQVRSYEAEAIVAYAGDICEYLYVLLEGRVRGELTSFKGKNVIVDDINSPNTFAEAFLFATQNKILVNIVATTEAKILLVPKGEFLRLLHLESAVLQNYLNATANRFVTVSQKLRFLTLKKVKQKLAHYLLGLQRAHADEAFFELGRTHESLAALFGISRPALTKNLLELREEGVIEIKSRQVKILKPNALLSYLKED